MTPGDAPSPPPLERGVDGSSIELAGIVGRRTVAAGSHSERPAPCLVADDGRAYLLLVVGENPFEQPTLAALVGRRVGVAGAWRNGVVRVERHALRLLG